jgi:hypothetical protein
MERRGGKVRKDWTLTSTVDGHSELSPTPPTVLTRESACLLEPLSVAPKQALALGNHCQPRPTAKTTQCTAIARTSSA